MSEENVEIVRRFYEAFERRDWDAMFRDTQADFEMTTQIGPTAGTRRGREQVTAFAEDYLTAFDRFFSRCIGSRCGGLGPAGGDGDAGGDPVD